MSLSPSDYRELDGLAMAELVRKGEVSPRDLAGAAVARAEEVNPLFNAVVHPRFEAALAEAEGWTPGRIREAKGPFPGIPFLIKDLASALGGHPLTSGSRFMEGFVVAEDTELVRRYRSAGLGILGSTNSPEFGLQPVTEPEAYGPTRNPWDPDRTPGGSSGGSAAAVAAGIVPMAGGGDGGGSLRIPASCCGLFGLKPTRGRTPAGPDRAPGWRGFAVEHAVTRTVRDSAALLDWVGRPYPGALHRAPPPDGSYLEAAGRDPGSLQVAWTGEPLLGSDVHPDSLRALDDAVALLEDLGHDCREVRLPLDGEAFSRHFLTAVAAEVAGEVEELEALTGRRARPGLLEPETWALAVVGRSLPGHFEAVALRELERSAQGLLLFLQDYDVLVTPTLARPPVRIGELLRSGPERLVLAALGRLRAGGTLRRLKLLEWAARDVFGFIPWLPLFNVTGQPAMSVPLFWNDEGLPIGTHVVGRYGREDTLFALAGQLERARPWDAHRPPEDPGTGRRRAAAGPVGRAEGARDPEPTGTPGGGT